MSFLIAGCGKLSEITNTSDDQAGAASNDDEGNATPEERRFIAAAKPFVVAIAQRKYEEAYAQLSSHARARASLNQFAPEDDEARFERHERNPLTNVSAEKFRDLMKRAENEFGAPRSLDDLSVYSTDAHILNRRGKEPLDALDSMFAIGNMPESIPANVRRASLRGKVLTQLSPQQLEKIAKEANTTVAELKENSDFETYFTIKAVLVEEDGQLKVGYFELLPPSMLD